MSYLAPILVPEATRPLVLRPLPAVGGLPAELQGALFCSRRRHCFRESAFFLKYENALDIVTRLLFMIGNINIPSTRLEQEMQLIFRPLVEDSALLNLQGSAEEWSPPQRKPGRRNHTT